MIGWVITLICVPLVLYPVYQCTRNIGYKAALKSMCIGLVLMAGIVILGYVWMALSPGR